jgi:hypothetical protein
MVEREVAFLVYLAELMVGLAVLRVPLVVARNHSRFLVLVVEVRVLVEAVIKVVVVVVVVVAAAGGLEVVVVVVPIGIMQLVEAGQATSGDA